MIRYFPPTHECPKCGTNGHHTDFKAGCPRCGYGKDKTMPNPHELAQQARERAVANYTAHATYLTNQGDKLYPVDPDGAQALWLDAMKSLDAANTAAQGLNKDSS